MNDLLQLLNQNQGAIITILTAVYVVATIVTTWIVHRSNRLTRESNTLGRQSLQQAWQLERDRNRPYVIFDFVVDNGCVTAVLENIGKTPALNVGVSCNQELKPQIGSGFPFKQPIAFMAPGRCLRDFIGVSSTFYKENPECVFEIAISYSDAEQNDYDELLIVDLAHQRGLTYVVPTDHLKEVAKELKSIAREMKESRRVADDLAWELNSLLERSWDRDTPVESDFDVAAFLKTIFEKVPVCDRSVHMRRISFTNNKKTEEFRAQLLSCEKMGLVRRERSYCVLTADGYSVMGENTQNTEDQ